MTTKTKTKNKNKTTATTTYARIKEQTQGRQPVVKRLSAAASAGDVVRQGDLYITVLESVPRGAKKMAEPMWQLAPGMTQGSRHILTRCRATFYQLKDRTALDGPVIVLAEEGTITHPEHGHVQLPPGNYHVTYQRGYGDELRRVQD